MSGGSFDYNQYKIGQIADSIEKIVENNGQKISDEQMKENMRWYGMDWYERFPEELYHHKYPDEVIEKFKEAIVLLRKAEIYAQRVDWLISGDDGEQSFMRRLKEDLDELERKKNDK